jgi:hypothetical protein
MNVAFDHLVVFAASLDQGVAWCERTLGVTPAAGGRHPLMGTHNRLLQLATADGAPAYLEILAIDPDAPDPGRPRWFGVDDPALRARVAEAPALIHAVLRTTNIEMLRWGLTNLGQAPGEPLAAERETPAGTLKWRITVRPDGRIGADGRLPTLIEWSGVHPAESLPPSGVRLSALRLAALSPRVRTILRFPGVRWDEAEGAPAVSVDLETPRGPVTLASA